MEITDSHVTVSRLETYRLRVQLSRPDYVTYTKLIEDAHDIKLFKYAYCYCSHRFEDFKISHFTCVI